jgi:glucose-1-phosphate cytidylyltransferase
VKTVLLAGGLGTRLSEETALIPKPMVEIGGKPILWHIMNLYAAAGFREFVVALGYKGEVVKDWFVNVHSRTNDLTVDLASGRVTVHRRERTPWRVHLVDTGPQTDTGGRLLRLKSWIGRERFFMTYGDGVADVDVRKVLAFHRKHKRLATVLAVHPPSRFGELALDRAGRVARFSEKPQTGLGWINGGFFVLEPGVFDYIDGDTSIWERAPMERLAADGHLMAFPHDGFWQPMDTIREKKLLQSLWDSGKAPWRIW